MKKNCCGHNRQGNFCSECGKPLQEEQAVLAVITYLRTQASRRIKQCDALASTRSDPEYRTKMRIRAEEGAGNWSAWAGSIENLLAAIAKLKEGLK